MALRLTLIIKNLAKLVDRPPLSSRLTPTPLPLPGFNNNKRAPNSLPLLFGSHSPRGLISVTSRPLMLSPDIFLAKCPGPGRNPHHGPISSSSSSFSSSCAARERCDDRSGQRMGRGGNFWSLSLCWGGRDVRVRGETGGQATTWT